MRIAARIAVFALIGATATVLVAWGCAAWVPSMDIARRLVDDQGWPPPPVVGVPGSFDQWVPTEWRTMAPERQIDIARALYESRGFGIAETRLELTDLWLDGLPIIPMRVVLIQRSGWPSLSMYCVLRWNVTNMNLFEWLYSVPAPTHKGLQHTFDGPGLLRRAEARQLPALPLWPGFLVDTAFWGGAAFVVWSVPGFVRRAVRRRRGLCVRCGYELKELAVCPECGGGFEARTGFGDEPGTK